MNNIGNCMPLSIFWGIFSMGIQFHFFLARMFNVVVFDKLITFVKETILNTLGMVDRLI